VNFHQLDQAICERIESYRDLCVHLSDRLWDFAETAYAEHESAGLQIRELERHGFRVTSEVAGIPTAFVAEAGDGGPVIGFLGEYDALPNLSQIANSAAREPQVATGNGHGCGHNLLGGATLLSAFAVKDWLENSGLPGRVRYYGCPAEEGGAGKTFMTRAGVFGDLDAALTWHPASIYAIDAMATLATLHARFTFTGVAAHAAAAHLGRSALDAVTLMNVGANYLREHMPGDARLHYALHDTGGTAPHVIQARAEVVYQFRAPDLSTIHSLFERVRKIADGAALMTDTSVQCRVEKAMSDMRPNRILSDLMYQRMVSLGPTPFDADDHAYATRMQAAISPAEARGSLAIFGADRLTGALHDGVLPAASMPPLLPVSTDVGDVSWVVPTARCLGACFALGTPFHSWQLVAQGKSAIAHRGMQQVAKVMAATAAVLYTNPSVLDEARAELREQSATGAYVCPIPEDVPPPVPNRVPTPTGSLRGSFPVQYAGSHA
jgi:aminobenzoyl-glutamate utilization protein B